MKHLFTLVASILFGVATLAAQSISNLPRTIYSKEWKAGHIQGIAVDKEQKYIYYSFTTMLIKADMQGNIVGTVTGLLGHLGCIEFNDEDGRIYGSLEYKNDSIGRGILKQENTTKQWTTAFYVAIFDVDKITREGMNAEKDGIMTSVYIPTVLEDFEAKVISNGKSLEHRHGCSGFDGITFQIEYRFEDLERYDEYKRGGYDSTFTYCWEVPQLRPTQDEIIAAQMKSMYKRAFEDPYYYIPLASKQWDPRPRMDIMPELYGTPETSSLWNLTPEKWRELLENIKNLMDTMPKDAMSSKVLILDNWNEWDEGHYLSPHYEGGFKYLQAVREVFTKRDNLPDYRTPEFLGFDSYDKNWGSADYSKYCVGKKLK